MIDEIDEKKNWKSKTTPAARIKIQIYELQKVKRNDNKNKITTKTNNKRIQEIKIAPKENKFPQLNEQQHINKRR